MYIGAGLIGLGIVWYVVYAIIYNRYLPKDLPEIVQQSQAKKPSTNKNNKKGRIPVTVVVTESTAPSWLALFGIPPVPLVLLGLIIFVVAAVINLFN